jgi:hypothetical protein
LVAEFVPEPSWFALHSFGTGLGMLSISVPVLSESFSLVGQNEVMFESDVSSVLPGFCFASFLVCSRNTLASNKFGIAGAYKEYVFCSCCAGKGLSHRKRERRNHAENEGARRRRVTDHAFREKMDIPLLQGYNDWFFQSP